MKKAVDGRHPQRAQIEVSWNPGPGTEKLLHGNGPEVPEPRWNCRAKGPLIGSVFILGCRKPTSEKLNQMCKPEVVHKLEGYCGVDLRARRALEVNPEELWILGKQD